MFTLDLDRLAPEERAMVALWEAHLKAELQDKDAHASCGTMVDDPYVNHVAVLTGGVGRRQLENYYTKYFIPGQPPRSRNCAHLAHGRTGSHRRRVRLPLHAFNPDGMALAWRAADGTVDGNSRGRDYLLREWKDEERADLLGPGVGACAVGAAGPDGASGGRRRSRSQGPRSGGSAVKSADEAFDLR